VPLAITEKTKKMESEIGTVTAWNDEKGFGFITSKSGGKKIFLHINEFSREHKRPIQGLSVKFNRKIDHKGRNFAGNVCPLKGHKKIDKANSQLLFSFIISTTFFVIIGILVAINKLPIIIIGAYLILSLVAFGMYKKDKSSAKWDEWRTPESTLHLISLIGGWPGALIAQNKLRHKSKKFSFKIVYWVTVIINCSILGWLLTRDGSLKFNDIIKLINLV
jgi:uncharacterized membrane protein YsdA (DUF1294 family)/cold shock CspA family protein